MDKKSIVQIGENEANDLIELINDYSGYDFSDYSFPSLLRRFQRYMDNNNVDDIEIFHQELQQNSSVLNHLIEEITVNVTEMFRDPLFFLTLHNEVLPLLKNLSHIKIWHAGCSSGEEAYSMAILLKENDLLDKSIIYATDINQAILEKARKGIFDLEIMKTYAYNYKESEAKKDFQSYFHIKDGAARINSDINEKIIFSAHNLVSEGVFNQFDLIICRNVLIYFNKSLQNNVFETFYKSLSDKGILAIGSKETLNFSSIENKMEILNAKWKIWRKKA
jgi:chemotaxis protein methyltransferase CheR